MKKQFVSILMAFIMMCPVLSFAEMNLSAMTDDEIFQLETAIKNEKAVRGLPESAILTRGVYIVGQEGVIPSGNYIFVYEYSKDLVYGEEYYMLEIVVKDQNGEKIANQTLTNKTSEHPTWSCYLPEGSTLRISYDSAVRIIKDNGIVFK